LIVDAEAVLSLAVAAQGFQPVARRNPQVVQGHGRIQDQQLAQGRALDVRPELPDRFAAEQWIGGTVTPVVLDLLPGRPLDGLEEWAAETMKTTMA